MCRNIFDKDFLHYKIVEIKVEYILENKHISSLYDLKIIIKKTRAEQNLLFIHL